MSELSVDDIPFAIGVKFNEYGAWSKPYTYKSNVKYELDDIVLVPTKGFFSVGKVVGCNKQYVFKPNIEYRYVIGSLKGFIDDSNH